MFKKMFKTLLLTLIMTVISISFTAHAWDYKYTGSFPIEDISVSLDGRIVEFDVPPQIINDRTIVPMRGIFEALGMTVDWDEQEQLVTAYYPETNIYMHIPIGSSFIKAYFGGDEFVYYNLDSPALVINGRILVPVRAISELLGCKVVWEADTKYVHIASLHRGNYDPAYLKDDGTVTWGDYYCDAICGNRGQRCVTIYSTEECLGEDIFIETQNGEYLFFRSGDNLHIEETENGNIYSIDYIPFPDTYTIYVSPTKNGRVIGARLQIDLDWNRT